MPRLTCKNHPNLHWTTKIMAISRREDGTLYYNHQRNIFFEDDDIIDGRLQHECPCPASDLVVMDEEEVNKQLDNYNGLIFRL